MSRSRQMYSVQARKQGLGRGLGQQHLRGEVCMGQDVLIQYQSAKQVEVMEGGLRAHMRRGVGWGMWHACAWGLDCWVQPGIAGLQNRRGPWAEEDERGRQIPAPPSPHRQRPGSDK